MRVLPTNRHRHLRNLLRSSVLTLVAVTALSHGAFAAEPVLANPLQEKTLVVWATPANLTQRGGSALTLDDRHSHFDGVVFGEIAAGRWMAGSDNFKRTQQSQESVPAETSLGGASVQIAIVYRGREVEIFRNGAPYSRYFVDGTQKFGRDSAVVLGLRHLEAQDGACFAGSIEDARIYASALTASQIAALKPNQPSDPAPVGWWHFENGDARDATGHFPPGQLVGAARVEGGRLILDGTDSFLVTPPEAAPGATEVAQPDVPEDWILNYHLMHPGAESLPGDPNAAFYLDGLYHLHYILRHPWKGRQTFAFVHVTSPDLLHWTWQPTILQRSFTGHGMFSGTGFIAPDGRPAAIYHGESSGRNQIAIATDRKLSGWEKPYPVEVKRADGSPAEMNHWDPDCFRIGDTYYAISGGNNPPVFKSKDLRNWTLIGDFVRRQPPDVVVGEDISCPNFFPLGNQWMLLCISHPLGCRYYLGDWDAIAEQFVPRTHGRMNWARNEQLVWGVLNRTDFFAPESVETPDGRRVMWAWLTSAGPDNVLLNRSIQSLPRELSLPSDGRLRIHPLRELEGQRRDPVTLRNVVLSHAITGHGDRVPPTSPPALQRITELPGDSAEFRVIISRSEASRKLLGFVLFAGGDDPGLPILLRPDTGTLRVGTTEAPFAITELADGEDLELRVFVDKYLVEVFANGRQAVLAAHPHPSDRRALDGFTVGAPTTVRQLDLWRIEPTNQGFYEARTNRVWEPKQR
ncbi:MAG TPA: GH32 C-terminal domain-containing protein [Verrucomicrobiota bacterium]|nr:GH32 C-terminal domain-containing protein [Verrucomicrobiota bacterium]